MRSDRRDERRGRQHRQRRLISASAAPTDFGVCCTEYRTLQHCRWLRDSRAPHDCRAASDRRIFDTGAAPRRRGHVRQGGVRVVPLHPALLMLKLAMSWGVTSLGVLELDDAYRRELGQ